MITMQLSKEDIALAREEVQGSACSWKIIHWELKESDDFPGGVAFFGRAKVRDVTAPRGRLGSILFTRVKTYWVSRIDFDEGELEFFVLPARISFLQQRMLERSRYVLK